MINLRLFTLYAIICLGIQTVKTSEVPVNYVSLLPTEVKNNIFGYLGEDLENVLLVSKDFVNPGAMQGNIEQYALRRAIEDLRLHQYNLIILRACHQFNQTTIEAK